MVHPPKIKILTLSASPTNTDHLRLDVEVRGIKEELERAHYRDCFEIYTEAALRVDDLSRALLKHKPNIVHFSGHGAGNQGLVLEDNDGKAQFVATEALSRLFKWGRETIKCVFLNACFSQVQAIAIHQNIDCVVGMNQAIGDRAAIQFAAKFYQALANGESFQSAYEYACTALDLLGSQEASTPEFLSRNQDADPFAIKATPIQAREVLYPQVAKQELDQTSSSSHRDSSITIGGSVTGSAITSGDNNTIAVTFQAASLPEPTSVNIKAEIDALRQILAPLASPDRRKLDNALADIDDELAKPQPDKDEVGQALDRAMTYAQRASGFAEAIAQLRPHVERTAAWLGKNWYKLLAFVGLAM